jgi:uncharacterized protein (AIM24 family)
MADFMVVEQEGQRYVKATLRDESIRAEAGALAHMNGDVEIFAPVPNPWRMVACALSDEPVIRPRYQGTGEVVLAGTLGGYHVFELSGEPWVLERGAYWCSDGGVKLGLHRERVMTSFWAGDGFVDFQTKVTGQGKVVLNAAGPVEEIRLDDSRIAVEGKLVIARTIGLDYRIRRPTKSLIGYYLSREQLVRTFAGTGRVLMCETPYWSERMIKAVGGA